MNHFFKLGENVVFENPMGTFSRQHFFVLFLTLVLAVYTIWTYKQSTNKVGYRRKLAIFILLVVLSRHIVEWLTGQYTVHRLPLHLCTVGAFIKLYDAYRENDYTKEILFLITLPAAFVANIFPDWTHQPLINFNTWQQFLFHALIVNYVLMRLLTEEIVPHVKKIWIPILSLVVAVPLMLGINHMFGTNFFFVSTYSPNSPLETIYHQFGSTLYLPVFLLIVFFIFFVIYAILGICRRIHATLRPKPTLNI
ncbi:MAG: YwaF family protein [Defluviitaleaceae bacterium]|nr:YwaF family protein [Defluviitaleaceae bacterium]